MHIGGDTSFSCGMQVFFEADDDKPDWREEGFYYYVQLLILTNMACKTKGKGKGGKK